MAGLLWGKASRRLSILLACLVLLIRIVAEYLVEGGTLQIGDLVVRFGLTHYPTAPASAFSLDADPRVREMLFGPEPGLHARKAFARFVTDANGYWRVNGAAHEFTVRIGTAVYRIAWFHSDRRTGTPQFNQPEP